MSDPHRNDGDLIKFEDGTAIILSKKCPQDPPTAPNIEMAICVTDGHIWLQIGKVQEYLNT